MLKDMLHSASNRMIKAYLEDAHAHDLADEFIGLDPSEREKVYRLISNQKLAELVSYLEAEEAADILAEFDLEKQKTLVEMMEPDDAADIIQELEDDEQESLIAILGETADVVQLISYDEDETGSAMTNLVVVLHPEMDVKQATKKVIKEAPDVETINTLFVTDAAHRFLGVVQLKDLLKAKTPCQIETLIQQHPFVYDTDLITQSLEAIRNYNIYEMPVCNEDNQLVGMITMDDALDIYQEEAQEDFERLAGLPETIEGPAVKTALHRLPWLITLLALSIPIALVTSLFEEVLAAVVILIVFQPLILDSAGNVATQTLAVTLKMMATNEKGLIKNSYREIITGMINGLVIGAIAFGMTYVFATLNTSLAMTTDAITISFVVGFSLWMTVLVSPVVAILIPITIRLLRFDPAVASGPFITTLVDIAALFIYFGLATLMLGGL
ncbi:MAG: magnesium transporter [Acholeplasmataceae bacterium]|nr:MAG: magnesium transporter [Acholeplasmataceae bacterium]